MSSSNEGKGQTTDLAIGRVYTGQVDAGQEANFRWSVRVVGSTGDFQRIDAVLMHALHATLHSAPAGPSELSCVTHHAGPKYRASPFTHGSSPSQVRSKHEHLDQAKHTVIVSVFQSIRDVLLSKSLFTLLQLFQQPKVCPLALQHANSRI